VSLDFLNDDDHLFARDVIAKMMAFNPKERIKLVPDAVDQLKSNWESYNKAITNKHFTILSNGDIINYKSHIMLLFRCLRGP